MRTARGLSPYEVVSVVVILALVAGLAAVGLASSHERSRLGEAVTRLRDLDARARLLAGNVGPIVLDVTDDHQTVWLHALETDELLGSVDVPAAMTVHVATGGASDLIVFDRMGRSPDYTVTVRASGRVKSWETLGISGQIVERTP
jgi:Tfp pilus assembly protein FimT